MTISTAYSPEVSDLINITDLGEMESIRFWNLGFEQYKKFVNVPQLVLHEFTSTSTAGVGEYRCYYFVLYGSELCDFSR